MVFIREKQYHVTLDCLERIAYELEGKKIPVWVIQPGIRKTTEKKASRLSRRTLVFIADDASKDIVKIKTRSGYGTFKLRLVRFEEK